MNGIHSRLGWTLGRSAWLACVSAALLAAGCSRAPDSHGETPTPTTAHHDDHDHDGHDHGHDHHGDDQGSGHGHGDAVELGTVTIGSLTVVASREGDVVAGESVPVDASITGGEVEVVRFWIGSEDGRGSLKAKADREEGGWHTHVEVPDPLPADARLWIELERSGGERSLASLDLRR